ncbi:putative golgin subfamily A member 8F/8G [Nomascus leucogenys]|uniref:putative golgin subfamily A member 8F/8G n=1 Tax=Nomascus leucogenys TaxID=61853 RepID=UPI00122D6EFE|nr:putative golgin subfamily A member 8F/8G [Nomascus leucogenys]
MLKKGKSRLLKLRRSLFKLKHQTGGGESRGPYCLLPFSAEPLAPEPPAGPSEVEQLQVEINHLKEELESARRQLQAKVENNKMLLLLSTGHKERLQTQEKRIREREESIHEWEERIYEWDLHIRKQEERLCEWGERLYEWEQRLQEREERLHQQKKLPGQERPRELERMLEPGWEDLDEEWEDLSSASEDLALQLLEQKVQKKPGELKEMRRVALGSSQVWTSSSQLEAWSPPITEEETVSVAYSLNAGKKDVRFEAGESGSQPPHALMPRVFLQVELKSQEAQSLQQQPDHYLYLCEASLTDSVEPAPGEEREGSPHDNPTAQQIQQLLSVMQDSPGLGGEAVGLLPVCCLVTPGGFHGACHGTYGAQSGPDSQQAQKPDPAVAGKTDTSTQRH